MRIKRTFSLTKRTADLLRTSSWEQSMVVEGAILTFFDSEFESQLGIINKAMRNIYVEDNNDVQIHYPDPKGVTGPER